MGQGCRISRRGFTLIELLTVCAIISLLASILVPNFLRSLDNARLSACQTNLKNIATALQVYANDNENLYPNALSSLLTQYISSIPTCPSAIANTYSAGFITATSPANFTIYCTGSNHRINNLGSNEPYFSLRDGLGPR
jgi:prepilin-type N-terminal cleavage/methylation domain-containing protein